MQVQLTAEEARRRRRHAQASAQAAATVPSRVLTPASAMRFRTFPVAQPSKAGGTWTVDWERAHADAQKVLDAIDFSKHDIVIWVPGTSNHGPHPAFRNAVGEAYRGEGSNLVALEYEASWHLRRSLPTGIATMRLVLEGIRARGGNHRVLLSGESQGAWIIGEVLADPAVSSIIDRAVLVGHPWLAAHQYDAGQDPRVRVINHDGDMVAMPVKGDPTVGLDAMLAVRTLDVTLAGSLLKGITANPKQGVELLKSLVFAVPGLKSLVRNPHVYDDEMSRAVEFLRQGTLPASVAPVNVAAPAASDPAHEAAERERLTRSAAIASYSQLRAA